MAATALRDDEVDRVAPDVDLPGRRVITRGGDLVLDLPPAALAGRLRRRYGRVVARRERDLDRDPLVVVERATARGLDHADVAAASAAGRRVAEGRVDVAARSRLLYPQ